MLQFHEYLNQFVFHTLWFDPMYSVPPIAEVSAKKQKSSHYGLRNDHKRSGEQGHQRVISTDTSGKGCGYQNVQSY
jgi:hypothetical protein